MNYNKKIATGVAMVWFGVAIPSLTVPAHLELWQTGLMGVICISLSWFGTVYATRNWTKLRIATFLVEREHALAEMDNRYQPKELQ